jgi:hypothetical protein
MFITIGWTVIAAGRGGAAKTEPPPHPLAVYSVSR